jgi:hypothetical protein
LHGSRQPQAQNLVCWGRKEEILLVHPEQDSHKVASPIRFGNCSMNHCSPIGQKISGGQPNTCKQHKKKTEAATFFRSADEKADKRAEGN